jgi:glycosyltransferase involved in cell wall biosynthesis
MILTYNEEANIGRCLESIRDFTDDIVIVDSFSTDRTLEICEKYGCRIYQHEFMNQAIQFNWAIENVPLQADWVLRLDADEILPAKLKQELASLLGKLPSDITGIYLNRRMYFMNRWLKHGGIYPHYILRVFRKGAGRYEEKTEEHFLLGSGRAIYAENDFLEDNRQNTLKYWLKKHNDLSDGEMRDTLLETRVPGRDIKEDLFGTKVERTRWLKIHLYARSPLFFRAGLYFIYRYLLRLGFLDGAPGLIFHVLQAFWYRFYVDARIYETRSKWQNTRIDYADV